MGFPLRHLALVCLAGLAATCAPAQTAKTWTASTEWADFATGANWSGGTAPTSNTTTNYALFTNANGTLNHAALAASRSIAGLEFSSASGGGALSYETGTPVLTLGAYGLRNYSLGDVNLDVGLALGASSTFLDSGSSSLWISSALNLGANTLTLSGTSNYSYARLVGTVSGTGGITLNHTGTYGWILGANNTYSGTTTLTAGRVIADTGGFGTGTLVFNGGTLITNTAATFNNAVTVANTAYLNAASGNLTLNGTVTMTGSRTFDVAGTGAVVLNGAVGQSSAGYGLTKNGTGDLILNAASTYTGTTLINAGSLALGAGGTISNANLYLNGGTFATSGTFNRNLGTGAGQFQFGATGGGFAAYGGALTVSIANGDPLWGNFFNSAVVYFGSTVSDNVVTLTNNLQLYSGDYTVNVADNAATAADKTVFSGTLAGDGNLTKLGSGQLDLTGASTRTGWNYVLGGILRIADPTALGTGNVTLQSSTLQLAVDDATDFGNNVNVNSGTSALTSDRLTAGAGVTHELGNLSLSGTLNLKKGANITSGTAGVAFGSGSGAGTLNLDAGTKLELASFSGSALTVTGAGDATVLGAFTTGASALVKSGTGALTLNSASTRTGSTTLNAGTLTLNASGALGTGSLLLGGSATLAGNGNVTVANALTNTGAFTLTVANAGTTTLSGNVALSNNATNRFLTITNNGEVILSGAIANGGTSTASGLVKNGPGRLTLSGASTFGGSLSVAAGELSLTGSITSSLVSVTNGATLSGGASLHDLALAGTYAPGNGVGAVSLDSLAASSTALLRLEIAGATPGIGHDVLNIGGAFAAAGTLDVLFAGGYTPVGAQSFQLFNAGSFSGAFSQINLPTLDWHWAWDTSSLLTTGQLNLNFTPVPEPSTYALLAAGLGFVAFVRRRRK